MEDQFDQFNTPEDTGSTVLPDNTPSMDNYKPEEPEQKHSAVESLFKQNRVLQERIEQLERREEERERRISNVETFIRKIGQTFSDFFREKGVNISEENAPVSQNTTQEGYLDQRPEMDMDTYKAQLESQGLSPQEIVQRISKFDTAVPFEGGVNVDSENQSQAPEDELSEDEYLQHRPSMDDFRKQVIQEEGGVTKEAAQRVNEMRDRIDESTQRMKIAEFDGDKEPLDALTSKPEGVNLDPQNQILKEEKTTGQLIDEAEERGQYTIDESGQIHRPEGLSPQQILNLSQAAQADKLLQDQQQPEIAPIPA
jgi:hypothetical protein